MTPDPLPWDDLADALERLDDARRHGTAEDVGAAECDAARARDRLAALGELLLLAAVRDPSLPLRKRLRDLFGLEADATWDRATAACKLADRLRADLDAIRQRVNELQRQVDDLTPGIGPPGLRLVR